MAADKDEAIQHRARQNSGKSRRAVTSGLALALTASGLKLNRNGMPELGPQAKAAAAPNITYEVLEVGPGKRFPSLTLAGCFMNSIERWNNGYIGAAAIAKMGFRIIISPGPPGYYTNDSGSHSRRWPKMVGWPPYEGGLFGPVIIEGEPGKAAPILDTDGYGDGVLYYQTGLFATGSCDATFRHLVFRGFRRKDDIGNYAAVRLGQTFVDIPMNSQVLFEDCEFSGCDDGIMGGGPGQSLTLRRCYFHDNGNDTGRVHNVYFGDGDVLTVEDTLSSRCRTGHLLKTRSAKTIIRNTRLLGNGVTESACLDVPDAGVLDIDGLVCEKSPGTDASWIIHYAGENQDATNGVSFHHPSSIKIRNLTMIAPSSMTRHPSWGCVGFANQSGSGEAASGKGSFFVKPDAQDVKVFGLTPSTAGLPCTVVASKPALDLTSPIKG
jgi:hypothetical protein